MKVLDIIASALKLIGHNDLIPYIDDQSNSSLDDANEIIETLLYCFNAVEDELARNYIPLTYVEEMSSADMRFNYSAFKHYPVKIRRVTSDGKQIPFEVLAKYMQTKSKNIAVEYEYAPKRKIISDNSDYGGEVGEHLIALGIASEYSVINGEAEMADIWEKRYRDQLDRVQRSLPVCASIPPRRWV